MTDSSATKEKEFVMVLGHLRDRELRQMWKVVHESSSSLAAKELREQQLGPSGWAELSLFCLRMARHKLHVPAWLALSKHRFNREMLGTSEHDEASAKTRLKKVSFTEFIPWATQLRIQQREEVRRHHGFGKERHQIRDLSDLVCNLGQNT